MKKDKTITNKMRILYVCTGKPCRSQMAEAWTNTLKGDQFTAYSAGIEPKTVDPRAVKAMAEAGVDMSVQQAKDIVSLGDIEFDYVVTVCDTERESCPFFPAKTRLIHRGFDNPPTITENTGDEEKAMVHYRRVRDEIRAFVEKLPELLGQDEEAWI